MDEQGNLDEEGEWKMRMRPFMYSEVKLYPIPSVMCVDNRVREPIQSLNYTVKNTVLLNCVSCLGFEPTTLRTRPRFP